MNLFLNSTLLTLILMTLASCYTDTNSLFSSKDDPSPSVKITSGSQSITMGQNIPIKITFNKPVTGFDPSDILITGGTIRGFSGSGSVYECEIVPDSRAISIQILSGASTSETGHSNAPSDVKSFIGHSHSTTSDKNSASCFDPEFYRTKNLALDI